MLSQGTRAQVMHGTALKTAGGLRKNQLRYNKSGKIVSRLVSDRAKKEKRLEKAGWTVKKGEFGAVQMRGGGKFELTDMGNKKTTYTSRNTNKQKKVTPCPLYMESMIDKDEYDKKHVKSFGKEILLLTHAAVVDIYKDVMTKIGYTESQLPSDYHNKPTRHLISYFGATDLPELKQILQKFKKKLPNHDFSRLKNIAERNNLTNPSGIKLKSKTLDKMPLWFVASVLNSNLNSSSSVYVYNPNNGNKSATKRLTQKRNEKVNIYNKSAFPQLPIKKNKLASIAPKSASARKRQRPPLTKTAKRELKKIFGNKVGKRWGNSISPS
jgi:hypothetical protein